MYLLLNNSDVFKIINKYTKHNKHCTIPLIKYQHLVASTYIYSVVCLEGETTDLFLRSAGLENLIYLQWPTVIMVTKVVVTSPP